MRLRQKKVKATRWSIQCQSQLWNMLIWHFVMKPKREKMISGKYLIIIKSLNVHWVNIYPKYQSLKLCKPATIKRLVWKCRWWHQDFPFKLSPSECSSSPQFIHGCVKLQINLYLFWAANYFLFIYIISCHKNIDFFWYNLVFLYEHVRNYENTAPYFLR